MAKAKRPPLTWQEVARLNQAGESVWGPFRAKCKLAQDVYFSESDIGAPEILDPNAPLKEPYQLHMARGADIQDSFRGLVEAPSRIACDTPAIGSRTKERSEAIERFGNAYMPAVEFEQGGDVEAGLLFEVGLYGLSFCRVLPDPTPWKGKWPKQNIDEETGGPLVDRFGEVYTETDEQYNTRVDEFQQTAPFPIRVYHDSSLESVPVMDGKQVITHIRKAEVPVAHIEHRYRAELEKMPDAANYLKTMTADQKVWLVETCDDTYAQWLVMAGGGEWGAGLRTIEHKMPLPEGQAPVVAYRGFTTSLSEPAKHYRGILDNVIQPLMAIDMLASRQMTIVGIYFWLTLVHRKVKGDNIDPSTVSKLKQFYFGGVNHLAIDETLEVLGPPSNLPELDKIWQRLEDRLRMHWSPAMNEVLSARSSGYLFQLIREDSMQKARPAANNIAQGDAERYRYVIYAIGGLEKQLKRPGLRVYARYVKDGAAESIGTNYTESQVYLPLIKANREPDMPSDELAKLDAVEKAIANGMPSARAWRRYGDVDDPEQMSEELIGEELENADPIKAARIARVLDKMDLLAAQQNGMTQQAALAAPDVPPSMGAVIGATTGQTMPPTAEGLKPAPNVSPGIGPQALTEQPTQAAKGLTVAKPKVRRINPRAGTRTRPGGPHKKAPPEDITGASQ